MFSLREKADADQLYLVTLNAIQHAMGDDRAAFPEIATHIEAALVDRYFCNFSVFQSLPDNWAIDQLFPIMPIHRLDRAADPARHAAGRHLRFGRRHRPLRRRPEGQASLELHPVREGEPYILGIFLTGAYQEILGDLHNLFGDTNAVHVRLTEQGYEITDLVHGDTVTEVLNYVQFQRLRPARHVPPQGERGQGSQPAGSEQLHRRLRGGAGGVHVSGGGCAGGIRLGEGRKGGEALERMVSVARLTATLASRLLRLVLVLQPAHHRRIRQGRRVTQRPSLGDVLEQPPHDLAAPGLGQVGREEDVVRPGDRPDLLGHVRLELVLEARASPGARP